MEELSPLPAIDPDFEPQSRPRSCTWPLPRPDISAVKQEPPDGGESAAGTPPAEDDGKQRQHAAAEPEKAPGAGLSGTDPGASGGVTPRKGSSRRNAWGNQSYADLISQAIENSPEKRLTLAQIYEWMVKTVPYFRDKGDSNSSAGWKNSIRHNLSLHNKFLRVHNESTGKSSWWMLNPEGGKTGKAPRRRAASMDNGGKLLKSRVRAKQTKKQAEGAAGAAAGADSPNSSQQFPKWGVSGGSPSPRGVLDDGDMWTSFRPRTSSNASTLSGRLSPIAPGQEDDESLADDGLLGRYTTSSLTPTLAESLMEELDLIDGLTLMSGRRGGASPSTAPPAPPTPLPSASTLLPRASSTFSPPDAGPAFGNSLFGSAPYGARAPSSLEALLTSDSPPPTEVLMSAGLGVGPKAPQLLLAPKGPEVTPPGPRSLQPPMQQHLHQHHSPLGLGMILSGAGPQHAAPLPAANPFGAPHCFHAVPERLPTDLDVDMFTENLDCDVDYIINSDLMDGDAIDFNFDPVLPAGQSYAGPATTQGSAHNWVPS
ncbi:forkhead box protein O4 [Corythoichthys intestinalis]|uniref:forkhead box protein O4 n=1 Tax=Corythoichthys intestinalis TaxID=161448 RepID=UPI0025A59FE6|nr:forkhead box protein O4 [Corythoichthys intestinalis]XP_061793343.1 forkhead box protein O4-like [Nerophis lumbriciformis]